MNSPDTRRSGFFLLAVFVLLSTIIIGVGYRYHLVQKSAIEKEIHNELESIAEMKVQQITAWRNERLGDARMIASNTMLTPVRRLLAGTADEGAREQVFTWMKSLRMQYDYTNVILTDLQGRPRLSVGETRRVQKHYAVLISQALLAGEPVLSDIHDDGGLTRPHMGLTVPLRFAPNGKPEGAMLMGIDPRPHLYPTIRFWPATTRSAETFLARRDEDNVVYLSELRHRKNTILRLRFPLTRQDMPVVKAALGFEGTTDGMDYRGLPVVAVTRKVPGSNWVLITKMDADEVNARARGDSIWLVLTACSLILAIGAVGGFVWRHVRSRLDRQKYEAELERRALLGHYDFLSRYANDIILLSDESSRIIEANDRALATYGYERGELIGMSIRDLRDVATLGDFEMQWRTVQTQEHLVFETRHRRKDGSIFPVEVSARSIPVEGRVYCQSIIRDITERKRSEEEHAKLQEQLQQAQKMESVGRLAGGVAHDFNNLLTVINGYAALISDQLGDSDPLSTPVSEIAKAGERAGGLTQQLLAISRKQVIEPVPVDLNSLVAEVSQMLRRVVGEDIEVVTLSAAELGQVLADPGRIHQILMNLAVNARDAMPGGGKLTIETGNAELDAVTLAGAAPGPYVLLTVTDTGIGMDEETLSHAFEPFFTTKSKDRGTGLGLSTVYGIVRQSGGWISANSEVGRGTTFKIYLPRLDHAVNVRSDTHPATASLRGTECILLVEDQVDVRKLAADVLKSYGYSVLEAASGGEAASLCEGFAGTIELMITDIIMPGMNGRELADSVRPVRPDMKVLFISGYADNVISEHGVLDPGVNFLPKPFSPVALAEKVREVLKPAC